MTTRADPLCERIARHGFTARAATTPADAVALTTALQAQDNQASRFGIRARSAEVTEAQVIAAIEDDRSIVRTWLLRGTIHLVTAADFRWLVRLIGPTIRRKYRTRWRQLGLTDERLDAMVEALPEVLAGGALTRHEIRAALADRGVLIDSADPQAPTHAVVHACTTGLVCRGPDRGRDATFVLVDDWLPCTRAGPSGDNAIAELARRYFAAYSPATPTDFATWSGLAGASSVALIADELTPVEVYGRPGYRLAEAEPARGVRLLGAFDNYLLGYRERDAIIAAAHYRRVYEGGIIHPVVLRDGQALAVWSLARPRKTVTVTPFRRLPKTVARAVENEVADLGRFVDLELGLELAPPLE